MSGRSVLRFVLWLLLLAACGWALVFGAVVVFGDDTETRLGGLVFAAGGGGVALAARMALNRVPAPHKARRQRPSVHLPEDAEGEFSLPGTGPFAKRLGLHIGPDGFEVKTLRGTVRQKWDEVEHFRAVRIGIGYGASVETVGYTLRGHRSLAQRFGRWMGGYDRSFPTLEAPPKELAETMERYRQRYSFYP